MTTAYPAQHGKSNYRKVFEAALRLSASEQHRLREELARLAEVHLVLPANSDEEMQEGHQLADAVRAELAKSEISETLPRHWMKR